MSDVKAQLINLQREEPDESIHCKVMIHPDGEMWVYVGRRSRYGSVQVSSSADLGDALATAIEKMQRQSKR